MSYGKGPYGIARFGLPAADLPSEERGALYSSDGIDTKTQEHRFDDTTGAYAGMDDIQQCIYTALCYHVKEPELIGLNFASEMEKRIRFALRRLTLGPEPKIKIKRIEVTHNGGTSYKRVEYLKYATNTFQLVEA